MPLTNASAKNRLENCAKAGDVAHTVAHELGHGCFLLRHPFDDAYGSSDMRERERTDFLMGYNDGSHLPKWQWDMTHNPAVFKPLVKEDEDGEMLCNSLNVKKIISLIRERNKKGLDSLTINLGLELDSGKYSKGDTILIENLKVPIAIAILLKESSSKIRIVPKEKDIKPFEKNGKQWSVFYFHSLTASDKLSDQTTFCITAPSAYEDAVRNHLYPPYSITKEKLPNPNAENADEIVRAINKYCNEFEINTPERMAHFLGQIGVESDNLTTLVEKCGYNANTIRNVFGKRISGAVITHGNNSYKPLTNPDLYDGLSMDENRYYFKVKKNNKDKWITANTDTIYEVLKDTILIHTNLVIDDSYVGGKNNCKLFQYVYCCEKSNLGNGDFDSGDGSRFRGRGFIQLTGKDNNNRLYRIYQSSNSEFKNLTLEQFVETLSNDIDFAIYFSMAFWKDKKINEKISSDSPIIETEIEAVTKRVNGGTNGIDERKQFTNKSYLILITQ